MVNLSLFFPKNINNKKPIVLFPARIVNYKGFIEFIEAAKILQSKIPAKAFGKNFTHIVIII